MLYIFLILKSIAGHCSIKGESACCRPIISKLMSKKLKKKLILVGIYHTGIYESTGNETLSGSN